MTAAKSAPGQGPKLTVIDNAHAVSPGQRLARARTQRNLSLEDVAKNLNLSVSMVRSLESDNFKSLPGHAFVRGYLRNYAKLVGLAPDDLVKAYESLRGDVQDASTPSVPPVAPRSTRWVGTVIKGVGYLVLLAVLAGIVGVIYQNFGVLTDKAGQLVATIKGDSSSESVLSEAAAPVAASEMSTDDETIRLSIPLHPVGASGGGSDVTTAVPASVDAVQPAVTTDAPVSAPADTSSTPSVAPVVPPQSSLNIETAGRAVAETATTFTPTATPSVNVNASQALVATSPDAVETESSESVDTPSSAAQASMSEIRGADGAATVSLSFSGKSWVGVRDANGKSLFNGIKSVGESVQFQGTPPLRVKIGNAPVVKVSFNGKPFDFDFSSRSNVAQFTLGDE